MAKENKSAFKGIFKRKSFWGAVLFAFALWVYSSLNGEYVTIVEVPVSVKLPITRAIKNNIRKTISIEVKGKGWNLFDLIFFNSSAKVLIDLTGSQITEGSVEIGRNEILRGVQFFKNVEAINAYPELITIETGLIEIVKVPIKSNVILNLRQGFTIVGHVDFIPDSIEVRGSKNVINNLNFWNTAHFKIDDIHKPFSMNVTLSDSMSSILTLSRKSVRIFADIQQISDLKINDIKFTINGGSPPDQHSFNPTNFDVTIRGGIDVISKITSDDILISIDYNQILSDSTGLIIPTVRARKKFDIISIDPPYLYHNIKSPNKFLTSSN